MLDSIQRRNQTKLRFGAEASENGTPDLHGLSLRGGSYEECTQFLMVNRRDFGIGKLGVFNSERMDGASDIRPHGFRESVAGLLPISRLASGDVVKSAFYDRGTDRVSRS